MKLEYFVMKHLITTTAILNLLLFGPALAQEPTAAPVSTLSAHEHGAGTLNIAIEGEIVMLELEVPGSDIVGFEHLPRSDTDKAHLAAVRKNLAKPLDYFRFTEKAGCKRVSSNVKYTASDEEETHGEFLATYRLNCSNIDILSAIEFEYFKRFSGARKLEVNVITVAGQKRFEVTRNNPTLPMAGIM